MQQLSKTDSGLLFYCDLESVLEGLKDFKRPSKEDDSEDDMEDAAETSR